MYSKEKLELGVISFERQNVRRRVENGRDIRDSRRQKQDAYTMDPDILV